MRREGREGGRSHALQPGGGAQRFGAGGVEPLTHFSRKAADGVESDTGERNGFLATEAPDLALLLRQVRHVEGLGAQLIHDPPRQALQPGKRATQ